MTALTAAQRKRLDEITALRVGKGESRTPQDVCVMQAVDYVFRNERHFSDHPSCSSPVLTSFAIRLNDARWPADTRTKYLRPLIPLLIGTKTTSKKVERKRRYLFVDFAVREAAPFAFDAAFKRTKKALYQEWAAKLRAVAPVVDDKTQEAARAVARDAAYAAAAADDDERRWEIRKPIYQQFVNLLVRMSAVTA